MPGRSTTEAIHLLRRLMEKYRERKKDLHLVFIDLEKAYDSIPQSLVWDSLKNIGISRRYIEGSTLSPFIFTAIMEEISKSIWEIVPWCMLFTNDIVLVAKTKEKANSKLEEWREALEGSIGEPKVTIGGEVVACTSKFKYLGSVIQSNEEIDGDASIVVWDRMLARKKFFEQRIDVTEMRMLRWMCGNTMVDKTKNQEFREKLGVAPFSAKMRKNGLRWFSLPLKTFHESRDFLTALSYISDGVVLASVFTKKIKKIPSKDQNDNPQQSKMAN
ncbi:uncharacterized protein LOC130808259 [Amaranthus tricolor]|uniref:uncharacterized protein LOC130808259 n=1 Tax=Amaranthus tricolor TaxID=29722 RepID=UPI00258DEEEC|nr:uncharacterized protein LOC130808259 [Amaranthus tricolor]